jgi:hypothetical protein
MWGVRKGAIFIHNIYHPLLFIPKWMNIPHAEPTRMGKKSK